MQTWSDGLQPLEPYDTVEERNQAFINTLTTRAEELWGKTKGITNSKYSKPWWSNECSLVIARRRRAQKLMERRPDILNIIEYRRLSAISRRTIKKAKK